MPTIWRSPDELWEKVALVLDELDPPAETGHKRSVIVDGDRGPLGAVVAGADMHDTKLLKGTIEAMIRLACTLLWSAACIALNPPFEKVFLIRLAGATSDCPLG